jgi:ABC-2 type transport system permease protein
MKAWLIAKKDLTIFFRDRAGVLLGFGLPIALATVFGAAMGAMGGGGQSMGRATLYLEDRDQSGASAELVEMLRASKGLRLREIEISESEEGAFAREHVAKGNGPAGLLIPEGYGEAVAAGEVPPLTLYRDPGKFVEQQIIAGTLVPALFEISGEGEAPAGFDPSAILTDALGLEVENVLGGDDAAQATKTAAQAHAVAGIAVMMLLFGLVACGGTFLEEEAEGTLERLRLAPGSARAILGGKFLFTFLIGLSQLAVLFVYGLLIFDLPLFRAPAALLLLSACVAASATGFGILLGVLCRTRKQLEGLSTLVILVMSALGGSWFPLSQTPEWFQTLGHFTLTAWAMDGYHAIFWHQQGLAEILLEMGILLAIAAATSASAMYLWTRRLRA